MCLRPTWNSETNRFAPPRELARRDLPCARSCPGDNLALIVSGLQEWAAQPAFSYRHEWQEGDLVIWDNYGLMHRVVPYDVDSGRMMHRTTLKREERVAA